MTARDAGTIETDATIDGFTGFERRRFDAGTITTSGGTPPTVNVYKMIGLAIGIGDVGWLATGAPDFTGSQYTGPGVLDLATISLSCRQ